MNRLRELRLTAELTQTELAKIAETTQRNISYWESGTIELNLTCAIKLAQYFQVTVEYLAGYSDEFNSIPDLPIQKRNYTAEEKKLIEDYRKLNFYKQQLIKSNIQAMLPADGAEKADDKRA